MRHLLLLLLACVLPIANKLQSQTLQFSQVLLISTVQTVPANKVWKVEAVIPDGPTMFNNNIGSCRITINNHTTAFSGWQGAGSILYSFNQPIWLPAGTTLAANAYTFRISVIEFSVVP
jgi:hypothetical protein